MRRIVRLEVNEVSAVDRPANRRKFLVIKSEEGGKNVEEILKKLEENERDVVVKALEEKDSKIEELEKAIAEAEQPVEEVAKEEDLPEPVQKRLDEMTKRLEVAENIAKAEREAREKIESRDRAQQFAKVGDVEQIADVFLKVDDEVRGVLEEIFAGVVKRLQSGDMFEEKGSGGESSKEDAGGVVEEIERLAKERVEKSENLTHQQAMNAVLLENPELYARWRKEKDAK